MLNSTYIRRNSHYLSWQQKNTESTWLLQAAVPQEWHMLCKERKYTKVKLKTTKIDREIMRKCRFQDGVFKFLVCFLLRTICVLSCWWRKENMYVYYSYEIFVLFVNETMYKEERVLLHDRGRVYCLALNKQKNLIHHACIMIVA